MRAREIFLIMLSHAGGSIKGKTLVQKLGFFLDLLLGLGLNYGPHFYGPYSPEMDAAIGQCKALGFVQERATEFGVVNSRGFEVKRFNYELTQDGKTVVEAIRKRSLSACSEIEACLDRIYQAEQMDYIQLSIAAKAIYILTTHNRPMNRKEIVEEAKRFNWEISEQAVDKVVGFLKKLDLVATN